MEEENADLDSLEEKHEYNTVSNPTILERLKRDYIVLIMNDDDASQYLKGTRRFIRVRYKGQTGSLSYLKGSMKSYFGSFGYLPLPLQ